MQCSSDFRIGTITEPSDQQGSGDLTLAISAKVADAITAIKQPGTGVNLEELMPEPFRIDVLESPLALLGQLKDSFTIQLADVGLFLTANNLLNGDDLVRLIQRVFDADDGLILEKLFKLRSPTVQAFSCRILETISATSWQFRAETPLILKRLLRCGLDRAILAGPTGGRCLQMAIYHGNEELSLELLRNNVQRSPKLGSNKPFSQTPTELAESYNQKSVLRVLLGQEKKRAQSPSAGYVQVEPIMNADLLALLEACENSDFDQISLLLDNGVDVDYDRFSESEPLLERLFVENRQCYDILLPFSQFAKHFWTVSGIMSAAKSGFRELETYLNCKQCPKEDSGVLESAVFVGLENGMIREIRTILGLKLAVEWLDLNNILTTAADCREIDIMVDLVELGADVEVLSSMSDNYSTLVYLEEILIDGPEDGRLKKLLDIGWISLAIVFAQNLALMSLDLHNKNSLENLEFLVAHGLDLNSVIDTNSRYWGEGTPLQLTLKWGTLNMVEYLVDAGALVNDPVRKSSRTALGEAIRQENPEMVEFLLKRGANTEEFAKEHMTVLELLVNRSETRFGDSDKLKKIFKALLEAGADINGPILREPSANWNTALATAIMNSYGSEQMYLVLDAGADIHQIGGGEMARTPLQAAAERGRSDIAEELLKRGACVNALAAPKNGRTALQAACGGGKRSSEMISLLLRAGADVSASAAPRYGRTALQALCSSEAPFSELMALLIEHGADINAPPAEYGGITALQGAAIAGNIKIVMLLIDKGALVNAPPSERKGRMALDGAAEHGRLDTVQLLLSFGAKCMVPGISGWDSAIQLAEENGHFVIADILRENKDGFEE